MITAAKSGIGTFETCPPILRCPFTGIDRKSPWSGQTDANDPSATTAAIIAVMHNTAEAIHDDN